nr:hypothetical protein [Tanacetum cinerariifolium]
MDLKYTQNNVVAKLSLPKQDDYEMWKLRIEPYFQVQDYALWDVIENGNCFKPKKNDVKARSMLLMALPNEHLLTFSQYKDAKTLFESIQARFGGNDAIKKTQRTLLKQMYKNFNAHSSESLESIFNRLQKIISQLAILGENISQEDLNLKFLRSFPFEWNTHVVVWRDKADLDTMSIDDLYNNFKIVKQEVKRTVTLSSSSGSQNMVFLSSLDITNKVDTANIQAHQSPRNKEIMPRNQDNSRKTVNVEDTSSKAMVAIDGVGFDWSYMADDEVPTNMALMAFSDSENDNSFKLVPRTIANADGTSTSTIPGLVTTEKKAQKKNDVKAGSITNEVDTASIQVSTISTPVSTVSSHDNTANLSEATMYAFLENQPNGSQLVHEDLEQIYDDDPKEIDLKWQLALLSMRARRYFQKTGKKITINGSDTAGYDKTKVKCFNCHKMGHFARECRSPRNQESMPRNQDRSRKTVNVEDISSKAMVTIDRAGFDWSYMADDEVPTNMALMAFSDSEVQNSKTCSNTCLKSFETLKTQYDNLRIEFNKSEFDLVTYKSGLASVQEQLVFYMKNEVVFSDQITIKIDNFENASKSLDKLIASQITDNSRTGLGFTSYNAVAPLPTGLFAPLTIDLSNSGLEEFQHPEFKGYGPKDSKSVSVDSSNDIKKAPDAPIIEDWVFDSDEDEYEEMVLKSDNMVQKPVLKNVEKGTVQREVRPVWNNVMRTNHQNFSNSRRNFAPTTVLTKFGIVPISTARHSSSRAATPVSAARPLNTVASKPLVNVAKPRQNALQTSHLLSRRPFYQQTALKNRNLNNNVNTAKANSINTAKGNKVASAIGKQRINAVKS